MTPSQRGQAMVEMALGVAIFLIAVMAAAQVGLSALAEEGAQSAMLDAARVASAALVPGNPVVRLQEGGQAGFAALSTTRLGMSSPAPCSLASGTCGVGPECQRYHGSVPVAGSDLPCRDVPLTSTAGRYGPAIGELDGPLNPACRRGDCFGVATNMGPCRQPSSRAVVRICLAYTSWPPRSVDVWVSGALRTLLPWPGGAAVNRQTISYRIRLQVEGLV